MKCSALALDYDGTIALNGRFEPAVRAAIADIRQLGVAVILVTGRQIADLRRVAGDLSCFDVVVAENGAVLDFPASGRHQVIGRPPHPDFLVELKRRGVPYAVGEVVVETDGDQAPVVLSMLRRLEQPLVLAFNRSRLMILPQAVAKSTGLRQALLALRLSIHNTVGIGDAENDHDLLDACEVGVAVSWGSPALRAVADEVIEGTAPAAVADYIRSLARQPRLSAAQMGRRRLHLGSQSDGEPVTLAIRGRTVLIAGEPGTGKSWLAGLLCEQLILQGYCLCIIDPEGDYRSLEALPSVITLGGDDPPPLGRELTRALRHPDLSVIVDLSRMPHRKKIDYMKTLLPLIVALRRRTGLPHKILLDEAHYYLGGPDSSSLIDPELAGYILVTYRVSGLAAPIRMTSDAVVFVTRETDRREVETLLQMCRPRPCAAASPLLFRDLSMSEAALLPGAEEALGRIRRFELSPRLTSHVRHRTKYLDVPVLDSQAFVFTDDGQAGPTARTLKELMGLLATLPVAQIEGHLRRHDFSRWLDDVFRDEALGEQVRALEERVAEGDPPAVAADIAQAIRARYEDTIDTPV